MSRIGSTRWSAAALAAFAVALVTTGLVSCSSKEAGEAGRAAGKAATNAAMNALTGEDKIARGRYLVQAIGGCGDCHTPGSFYGAPDTTRALAGSEVGWSGPWGTSFAANLTPDSTGIASWSEDDIVNAIQRGVKPDGSPVLPPMPWPDLAHLTPEDAHAIAAYLKSIPAVHHKVPTPVPPGKKVAAAIVIPPPSAWDAPKGPPPDAAAGKPVTAPRPGRPSSGAGH